jgi:hypothetical protein
MALASTDFLAVDRVGLKCMGIDASWPGYLNYAHQGGLDQYDLATIGVVGAKIAEVQPASRRRGPDAGVARPDAGPAAEPGGAIGLR